MALDMVRAAGCVRGRVSGGGREVEEKAGGGAGGWRVEGGWWRRVHRQGDGTEAVRRAGEEGTVWRVRRGKRGGGPGTLWGWGVVGGERGEVGPDQGKEVFTDIRVWERGGSLGGR